jgi:hypothetical protein
MRRVEITVPGITSISLTLVRWRAGDGQPVRQGEIICDIDVVSPLSGGKIFESTIELEAYEAGTVHQLKQGGNAVEQGEVIGWIEMRE